MTAVYSHPLLESLCYGNAKFKGLRTCGKKKKECNFIYELFFISFNFRILCFSAEYCLSEIISSGVRGVKMH